jgi:hypothetical protein
MRLWLQSRGSGAVSDLVPQVIAERRCLSLGDMVHQACLSEIERRRRLGELLRAMGPAERGELTATRRALAAAISSAIVSRIPSPLVNASDRVRTILSLSRRALLFA